MACRLACARVGRRGPHRARVDARRPGAARRRRSPHRHIEDGAVGVGDPCETSQFADSRAGAEQPRSGRPVHVAPLVRKELSDALANRWLIGYAVAARRPRPGGHRAPAIDSASGLALQAFGRTTATLMNLCLLLAPLVAVLMGAASIAGERERGTLEHLLAQPLSRTRLLLGKHAGLRHRADRRDARGLRAGRRPDRGATRDRHAAATTCCSRRSPCWRRRPWPASDS